MRRMATAGLEIDERDQGDVRLLLLHGDLDVASAPRLATAIDTARIRGLRRLLVDLTNLQFCDSTGLRALIRAARELRIAGGRLIVACPEDGAVGRLLDMTGLREALHVYSDVERATASLAR